MKLKLNGHKNRRARARKTWLKMAEEYQAGEAPKDIAKKYNKSVVHFYWCMRQLRNEEQE